MCNLLMFIEQKPNYYPKGVEGLNGIDLTDYFIHFCYIVAQSSLSRSHKDEWGRRGKGRVVSGTLGLTTDVRLHNQVCNNIFGPRGAVKYSSMPSENGHREQTNVKPHLNYKRLHFWMIMTFVLLVLSDVKQLGMKDWLLHITENEFEFVLVLTRQPGEWP